MPETMTYEERLRLLGIPTEPAAESRPASQLPQGFDRRALLGLPPLNPPKEPERSYFGDIVESGLKQTSVGIAAQALGAVGPAPENLDLFQQGSAALLGFVADPVTYVGGVLGKAATSAIVKAVGKEGVEKLAQSFVKRSALGAVTPAIQMGTLEAGREVAAGHVPSPLRIAEGAAAGALLGPAGQVPTKVGKLAAETAALAAPSIAAGAPVGESLAVGAGTVVGMKGVHAVLRKVMADKPPEEARKAVENLAALADKDQVTRADWTEATGDKKMPRAEDRKVAVEAAVEQLAKEKEAQAPVEQATPQPAPPPVAPEAQGEVAKPAAPTSLEPVEVRSMKVADIHADPERFQYKRNVDTEGAGVSLRQTKSFDPELAGVMTVWKDPTDGKTYVVNGHHRLALAKKSGVESVNAQFVEADTAAEARTMGALLNIAEGRGTPVDAAKLFRDRGFTMDDLRNQNIDVSDYVAREGLGLAALEPNLFQEVAVGKVGVKRGALIGRELPKHADQRAVAEMLAKKDVSNSTLAEMIRLVKSAPRATTTEATLFGENTQEVNLFARKADISNWVRKKLAREKKIFGFVADADKAQVIENARAGVIDVGQAGKLSDVAATNIFLYDKFSGLKGPVADALNRAVEVKDIADARKQAYREVAKALEQIDAGAKGQAAGAVEAAQAPEGRAEVAKPFGVETDLSGNPLGFAAKGGQGALLSPEAIDATRNKGRKKPVEPVQEEPPPPDAPGQGMLGDVSRGTEPEAAAEKPVSPKLKAARDKAQESWKALEDYAKENPRLGMTSNIGPKLFGMFVRATKDSIDAGIINFKEHVAELVKRFSQGFVDRFYVPIRESWELARADNPKLEPAPPRREGETARPDLANPGVKPVERAAVDAVDAMRTAVGEPGVVHRAQVEQVAQQRFAEHPELERAKLLDPNWTPAADGSDTVTAQLVIRDAIARWQQSKSADDAADVARMALHYRGASDGKGRASIARELAFGRDATMTPQQRQAQMASEALFRPPPKFEKQIRRAEQYDARQKDLADRQAAAEQTTQEAAADFGGATGAAEASSGESGAASQGSTGGQASKQPASKPKKPPARDIPSPEMAEPFRTGMQKQIDGVDVPSPETGTPFAVGKQPNFVGIGRADAIAKKWGELVADNRAKLEARGYDVDKILSGHGDDAQTAAMINDAQALKAEWNNKLYEYWQNAILSGPATQVTNALGNVAHASWYFTAERLAQIGIDTALRAVGRSSGGARAGELKHIYAGMVHGFGEAAKNFMLTWRTESPRFYLTRGLETATAYEFRPVAIFGAKGRAIRTPWRLLAAVDDFVKTLAAKAEAQPLAYRQAVQEGVPKNLQGKRIAELVSDPFSEPNRKATDTAVRLAFQEQTATSKAIGRLVSAVPGGKWVLPFITTPFNILKTGIRKTPFGSLKIPGEIAKAYETGDWSHVSQRAAEQVIAWGATMALMQMNDPKDPWITGGADQNRKYSVKIGGNWFSYGRIEPFATILGMLVDGIDKFNGGADMYDSFKAPFDALLNRVDNQTFFAGISDLMKAARYQDASYVAEWATKFPASWVPNVIRAPVRAADESVPNRRVWGMGSERAERILDRGIRALEVLPDHPKYDLWGRAVPKDGSPIPHTDWLFRTLSPITEKKYVETIGDRIIGRWNAAHPSERAEFRPPNPYYIERGKTFYMTDDEYAQYVRESGRLTQQRVTARRSGFNMNNPTERDIARLEDIIETSRARIRNAIKARRRRQRTAA